MSLDGFYLFQPYLSLYFIFLNLHLLQLFLVLKFYMGFSMELPSHFLWAMIADVADFSEWKNNRRATAIIFSAMMVGLKLGLLLEVHW